MRPATKLLFGLSITCLFGWVAGGIEARAEEAPLPDATIRLQGILFADDGQLISDGKVSINGIQATSVANGDYSMTVSKSATYSVTYDADQFYPIIHTFDNGLGWPASCSHACEEEAWPSHARLWRGHDDGAAVQRSFSR